MSQSGSSRSDQDATRTVRLWLGEGVTALPDHVLDTVLDQLPATHQRRSSWLARRTPIMNNTVRLIAAAAAVVVVAFVGYQLLFSPNTGGPGPSPSPTEMPSMEPTASPAPSVAAVFPSEGPVAIGRHPMTLNGVSLSIEFPTDGWISNGEWGIDKGDRTTADSASFILWPHSAPDDVFGDPCAGELLGLPANSSALELATAVSSIPGIDLVGAPSQLTVGGYPAQYVSFTVPETIGCAPTQFNLWEDLDTPESNRYATEVGETFHVWIIDVDGSLVWIDGETFVASGPEAEPELRQIVDSIQFE